MLYTVNLAQQNSYGSQHGKYQCNLQVNGLQTINNNKIPSTPRDGMSYSWYEKLHNGNLHNRTTITLPYKIKVYELFGSKMKYRGRWFLI